MIIKDYQYKIIKTKAVKIEILPAPSPEQELDTNALIQRYAHNSLVTRKTNERKKSSCVICGQLASHLAYFQLNKCQRMERYCSECLDKWVYLDRPTMTIQHAELT